MQWKQSLFSLALLPLLACSGGEDLVDNSSSSGSQPPPISSPNPYSSASALPEVSPLEAITATCAVGVKPNPVVGGMKGWASRYWDCCKPSCSWEANASPVWGPAAVCDIADQPHSTEHIGEAWSGCDNDGTGFACGSQAPWAVCDSLSYGFAAVPANDPKCGHCFQIDFDGGMYEYAAKPPHRVLKGKTMIVIASNIGGDVATGQFDLMIPGGGLGMNTAGCAKQWGVDPLNTDLVGEIYGGFSRTCELQFNYNYTLTKMRDCVQAKCDALFGNKPHLKKQYEGCTWYAQWMNGANNPTFTYKEVECPLELLQRYMGVAR